LGEFVYQTPVVIQDASLAERGLQVFLFSFDGRGDDFFPEVSPKTIYGHNILREDSIFEFYKNRLLEQSSVEQPIDLLLEPMVSNSRRIWRIVDTQLHP
jgi:hypothetical protein